MPLHKTAIAVPHELLTAIDELARRRGESRSAFITRVLRLALRARRDRDVTRRLDELFADDNVAEEQRREAHVLDDVGTDWDSERW